MFSSTATPAQSSKDTLGIAIFGAICLSTCGLGVWQLQRYTWKVDLLEQTKKAFELDSEAVPQRAFGQAELFAYLQEKYGQRIAIKGEFDHDNEVKIGPRAAPPGLITDAAQGMATNPQGYFIITPFKLSHGCTVFVNRGWVKRGAQDTIDRPKGIITLENIIVSSTEKVCASVHRELRESASRAWALYLEEAYEGGLAALSTVTQQTLSIWLALAPKVIGVWNHEISSNIKWLISIAWIPYVCYILDDRLEQVFLILYTITKLSGKREGIEASGGLWGLLLPSLVLASHALPSDPDIEPKSTRRWRILSITWHLVVIYMEVNCYETIDPSVESIVVGVTVLYIMSLDVWTGLSVLSLLLMAAAIQMQSLVDLRSLNTETVYSVVFAIEHHFF
tara:strand:+ start:180 stop:1358 length:1179 start_codon:yes stop_codon:yes gene_type:complete